MDVDRQLQELKKQADDTVLQDWEVDAPFRSRVKDLAKTKPNKRNRWPLVVPGLVASLIVVLIFTFWLKPTGFVNQSPNHPGWSSASAGWELSQKHADSYGGKAFSYVGEKPVRIMTTDLYEDQGQKTIWLLDGKVKPGVRVQIIGNKESEEQANLGTWTVGEQLFDATGHFPSSIALPSPGVWKLEVLTSRGVIGSVTVQVNAGVAPYNNWLEGQVINYIQNDKKFAWIGQPRFTAIDMFGVYGPSADQKIVYAWVLVESYSQDKGNLAQQAGWSFPAVFVVDYINGDYRVTKMEVPNDGSEYWSSIERIFPSKYHNTIKEKTGNVGELQKRIEKQAKGYFSQTKQ